MSLTAAQRQEISDLASRATDGDLDADGQKRLEEWLRHSPDARAHYVRFMTISAGLAWAARDTVIESAPAESVAAKNAPPPTSWRYTWGQVAAAAAVLVLGLFGAWLMFPELPPQKPSDPGLATLSTAVNIEWDQAQEPRHVGNVLKSGALQMKSGLAELVFISGTDVWVQGPAQFRLVSSRQAYLESGKVVVQVPHGSEGFQIDFPYGAVVDRGTAFGLDLRPGSVTVQVLDGSVIVTPKGGQGKTYVAGQAVTLDDMGNVKVGTSDARDFDMLGYGWNGAFELISPSVGPGHGHHGNPWDPSLEPQSWKGYDPMEAIRTQLGITVERWEVIKPALSSYFEAQWELKCQGFVPEENDYSRAAWDLYFGTQQPSLSDADLQTRLDAYREARKDVRWRRDTMERDLICLLTTWEEAELVDMGYLR